LIKKRSDIGVSMTEVTLPLDVALILVFRQQDQLFTMLNEVRAKADVNTALLGAMAEGNSHLHDDVRDMQGEVEKLGGKTAPKKVVH
jgi:hypothetical protein